MRVMACPHSRALEMKLDFSQFRAMPGSGRVDNDAWYAKVLVSTFVMLAICVGMLWIIRKRLTSRHPVGATSAAIAVVAATLLSITVLAGLNRSLLFPGLLVVAVFTGAASAHRDPWSRLSVLHALGISAGGIAVIATMTANYSAAALALIATGVLIRLHADDSVKRPSVPEHVRSATSII